MKGLSRGLIALVFSLPIIANAGTELSFKTGTVTSTFQADSKALTDSNYHVVQFHSSIDEQATDLLESFELDIIGYVPEDAVIVRALSSVAQQLSLQSSVNRVLPFQSQWKVSPDIPPVSTFNKRALGQLFIEIFKGSDVQLVVGQLKEQGFFVNSIDGRYLIVQLPLGKLPALAAMDDIQWIQPVPRMVPQYIDLVGQKASKAVLPPNEYAKLTLFESGTRAMGMDAAWGRGFTGAGEKVTVADTGLDIGKSTGLHSDFANFYKGYAMGFFVQSWEDPMGHGTHVAGSVAGQGIESSGKIRGAGYGAKLVIEGMWSSYFDNLAVPSQLSQLFQKAIDNGSYVHTNSWGSPMNLGAYDSMANQVDEFMFNNPELLVVFAAGNSGEDKNKDGRIDQGSVSSPSTAKNCLSVGASENLVSTGGIQRKLKDLRGGPDKWGVEPIASDTLSNNINGIAAFSSRGPTRDGRLKPDIVAPGTNVLSARSLHPKAQVLWGEFNSKYVWSGGTSMATPLAAGAAAVAREYLVKKHNMSRPSAAAVKAVLMHTATDLFPGQFGKVGKAAGQEILKTRPGFHQGYGRVDMDKATQLPAGQVFDEKVGVKTGAVKTYKATVGASGTLVATLVYTDAPGTVNAAKTLVNDLDLAVVYPNGTRKTLSDRKNNTELLELKALAPGEYTVEVQGHSVPQGKAGAQPFALVVTQ